MPLFRSGFPRNTFIFGNKSNVRLRLMKVEAIHEISGEWRKPPDDSRINAPMKVKLKFVQQEPLLFRFFYKVFLEIPDELMDEMASRFSVYSAASQDLFKGKFDQTKLKDCVDPDTAVLIP
jgi:hypothetical protein